MKRNALEGTVDEPIEPLTAAIDTTQLSVRCHTIFVESQDAAGSYGVFTSVFLDLLAAPKNAVATKGTTGDDDIVIGKRVNDVVYGRGGDDGIRTNSGTDIVLAGRGKDFVNSSADDDLLWGDDFLIGGKGADTYRLALNEGIDTISGFELGKDLIDLGGTIGFKQASIAQSGKDTLIGFQKQTGNLARRGSRPGDSSRVCACLVAFGASVKICPFRASLKLNGLGKVL